jgi:small redox-active disulfide protein 2
MIYIQIVGSGFGACKELENRCREIVAENAVEAKIEMVTDPRQFIKLGVQQTPGLLINGKVVNTGDVPDEVNILSWIFEAQT